jgi:hypothetical protein
MSARKYLRALTGVWLVCCGCSIVACDSEPHVLVGKLRPLQAGSAAGATAGSFGPSAGIGGERNDDNDPFEDAECGELDPVCGTDAMTYSNTCKAVQAGVQVAHRGAC